MEQWQDQGIVLAARMHGENGAIVTLLTHDRGRYIGYVRGAHSKSMRGALELGNVVDVKWQSRVADNMGAFTIDINANASVHFLHDPLRIAALQSLCALCDTALPEREAHAGLYYGTLALFDAMKNDEIWSAAYSLWEIAFLKELGFSLDLSKCASTGQSHDLTYVSPKTGRAVSCEAGGPYKDKLLPLPAYLSPDGGDPTPEECYKALEMTLYFLENWAFAQHSHGIPQPRLRLMERFAKTIDH